MSNSIEQITPLFYILGLMLPGMIATGVYDSLKNNKAVIASAILSVPLTIAIFKTVATMPSAGINRVGYLFMGALAAPIIYLVLAPTVYLLISGIHYLYVKYYS